MTQRKVYSGVKQSIASSPPLASIITVVYQAAEDLPSLIESVALLKDDRVEFLVIDGGSTDGTCEILTRYQSVIDNWVSEPDKGIYDAMNKGIAMARGTFVYHLNGGDRLLQLPLDELAQAAWEGVDVASFRVLIDSKRVFRPSRGFLLRLKNTIHHQGTFYRRDRMPDYRTDLKVFADFDMNQKLALDGANICLYDQVVASHMGGGLSDIQTKATVAEFFSVIYGNYGRSHVVLAWCICKWRGLKTRFVRALSVLAKQGKNPPNHTTGPAA